MQFNSSFISNANIGNWDYYIFSDNVGIWRALNGLAAWFNSSGPLLQGAAWLGALIILAMAIMALFLPLLLARRSHLFL